MKLAWVFFVTFGVFSATKGSKIRDVPQAAPNFKLKKYLGTWFTVIFKPPCTFNGAADHSNNRHDCELKGDYVRCQDSYRGPMGDCVTGLPARLKLTNTPGIFEVSDNIGRNMNGVNIVVAIDSGCWMVEWGCTKKGESRCDDAWISAKTRKRNPDPYTMKKILRVIKKIFDISPAELERRDQSSPCLPDPVHPKKHSWSSGTVTIGSMEDLNGLSSTSHFDRHDDTPRQQEITLQRQAVVSIDRNRFENRNGLTPDSVRVQSINFNRNAHASLNGLDSRPVQLQRSVLSGAQAQY